MPNALRRKKNAGCYHCGSCEHRARFCPTENCRNCGGLGHNVGGCPSKSHPLVDLGLFHAAAINIGDSTATRGSDLGNFTYAELFAGMGGFRVALDRLGGRCVFASETDRFCRQMYSKNFGGDRPAGDITQISSDQVPDHDLLVGGFPCQPFSSSGSRQGMNDQKGVLFREICRVLVVKQPKIFLLENVRGLLLHNDGDTLRLIVDELVQCGYRVVHQLIDSRNLLPQERWRLYFAGIRRDIAAQNRPYEFPSLPMLSRGVRDIIHSKDGENDQLKEDFQKLILSSRQLEKVRSQKYTLLYPEARFMVDLTRPAKTFQSSYSKYMVGSQFVPAGTGWRRFSTREAARLQGFPETFQLCSQRAYHMIGNAVAPPVVAMIVTPLLQKINLFMVSRNHLGWEITKQLLLEASPNDNRRELLEQKLEQT
ncbi:DNA-cytosine methyltransferase [Nitzschia inconspicua]|uniref:DNA-cytosine methyltransferase n=1 Tax=Nitzschia inconspicua TaxID=303405 RepID=A0A9K3PIC5_9STRA|nr:DNA-cytosine methyltransferase [Nitzschia inconspicua]